MLKRRLLSTKLSKKIDHPVPVFSIDFPKQSNKFISLYVPYYYCGKLLFLEKTSQSQSVSIGEWSYPLPIEHV